MDFDKICIELRGIIKQTRQGLDSHFVNLGITYAPDVIPILISEKIPLSRINKFRERLERMLKNQNLMIRERSYYDERKPENVDVIIDLLRILPKDEKGKEVFIAYHTNSESNFLNRFSSRAAEVYLSCEKAYAMHLDAKYPAALDDMIEKFLSKNGHSLDGFLKKCEIKLEDLPDKPDFENETHKDVLKNHLKIGEINDFNLHVKLYLAVIASMQRDFQTSQEEYFGELIKSIIMPFKRSYGNEVLWHVMEKFIYRLS